MSARDHIDDDSTARELDARTRRRSQAPTRPPPREATAIVETSRVAELRRRLSEQERTIADLRYRVATSRSSATRIKAARPTPPGSESTTQERRITELEEAHATMLTRLRAEHDAHVASVEDGWLQEVDAFMKGVGALIATERDARARAEARGDATDTKKPR